MKVYELEGAALDWAVAKCEGYADEIDQDECWLNHKGRPNTNLTDYCPSSNWELSGPIIEREKIGVWWATHYVDDDGVEYGNHWYAEIGCTDDNADEPYKGVATGPTPLIAAMRLYVYSKLGDEIDLPEELK